MVDPSTPLQFVIVTNSFDERSGGAVVLHLLCRRLNDLGEVALLWPRDRLRLQFWPRLRPYLSWLRYHLLRRRRLFSTGPFAASLAETHDLADAVVVYPEIVIGNPLRSRRVVRWLLHKPGFHNGQVDFGPDDLLFYYQDAFFDPTLGDYKNNRLAITWWNEEYKLSNEGPRSGSCYLIKKGKGRPLVHDLRHSVLIDDLSPSAKAATFNRTRYCYIYDPYTLYARYAALCGCIPIVVPSPGVTRDQWVPHEEERYGIAYGDEDIEWAVATRDLLLRQIVLEQTMEADQLKSFVAKCYAKFA